MKRGLVTVEDSLVLNRFGLSLEVRLNGHNVTNQCFSCDDREGWVLLGHKRNGHFLMRHNDDPGLRLSIVHGKVEYALILR